MNLHQLFYMFFQSILFLHQHLFKKFVRSFISGSIAQFFKIVLPLAKHAAIIEFSVAPTLIFGNFIFEPLIYPFDFA